MINSLYRYKIHHFVFWLGYFAFWMFVYKDFYQSLYTLFKVTGLYFMAHAGLYYFSQYVLLPKILKPYNPWLFILAFLLTAFLASAAMYLTIPLVLERQATDIFNSSATTVLFIFFFSNLSMVGLLLGAKAIFTSRQNKRKMERMEKERLESELQYLKAQVNPHFLFNTINSVYVLIKIDPDRASDTLIKLSELLRAQLYEFTGENITIEKEIEYLENYIALEKLRKGERLHVTFEKDQSMKGFKIPPLMLIPFLENCFKHLSSHQDKKNEVTIRLKFDNERFEANFQNTKDNHQTISREFGGLGLKNIKRRLELLYPGAYKLELKDLGDKFNVHLAIDIHGK